MRVSIYLSSLQNRLLGLGFLVLSLLSGLGRFGTCPALRKTCHLRVTLIIYPFRRSNL